MKILEPVLLSQKKLNINLLAKKSTISNIIQECLSGFIRDDRFERVKKIVQEAWQGSRITYSARDVEFKKFEFEIENSDYMHNAQMLSKSQH